ncbi:hypothetical protein CL619_04860 [archaeon]|nr:hypothetical protein [archaeon]|tara:strand:- start:2093 stop:3313 length:1221 start_codon:yes stop_codon:yes gene_type:complete
MFKKTLRRFTAAYKGFTGELDKDLKSTRTELLKSEEECQCQNTILESILEGMPTALVQTDCSKEQLIQKANRAFLSLYGYTSLDEVIGKPISILHPDPKTDSSLMSEIYQATMAGREWNGKVVNRNSDGDRIPVQIHAAPVYTTSQEEPSSLLATMIDLRGIEERETLAAIGRLAGGAIHDINNSLTVIIGYMSILQLRSNNEQLTQVTTAADRAANICSGVLSLRPKPIKPINQRLGPIINSLISPAYQTRIIDESDVGITYTDSNNWETKVDKLKVTQLVDNLIRNAVNALSNPSQKGQIGISTSDRIMDEKVTLYTGEELHLQGEYVVLEISDNGLGMDSTTQRRIFDPFFTTEINGKGTGLGLTIVQDVVKKHPGAYMTLDTEIGKGTTFTIYFPAVEEQAL